MAEDSLTQEDIFLVEATRITKSVVGKLNKEVIMR